MGRNSSILSLVQTTILFGVIMLEVMRLSDVLKTVLAGESVKIPCTIGMAKFYRKEIEKFLLEATTEPIAIIISPDSRSITLKKYPKPLPIEELPNA